MPLSVSLYTDKIHEQSKDTKYTVRKSKLIPSTIENTNTKVSPISILYGKYYEITSLLQRFVYFGTIEYLFFSTRK